MREALHGHRAQLVDSALAVALFAAGLWELLSDPFADDVVHGPLALNIAALAATTLPLGARRVAPFAVAAAIFGAIGVRALVADPLEIYPPFLAALIATYSSAAYARLRRATAGAAIAIAAIAIAAERGSGGDASPAFVPVVILLAALWTIGRVAGSRQARAEAIERRAAERERRREHEVRAAAAEERERIARELHDSVSHSLALIAMQSGGARAIMHRDPSRVEESLESIESAARDGLTEMRRLLGLLGRDGERAELSPQPGLEQVTSLVERSRAAGLDASIEVDGEPRQVPTAVGLSAYRIVQEALTNAAKHAGRCQVQVRIRWRPSDLELEITNDDAGKANADHDSTGSGLVGMRERAALVGGEVEAGPHGTGGYRVRARLPLRDAR